MDPLKWKKKPFLGRFVTPIRGKSVQKAGVLYAKNAKTNIGSIGTSPSLGHLSVNFLFSFFFHVKISSEILCLIRPSSCFVAVFTRDWVYTLYPQVVSRIPIGQEPPSTDSSPAPSPLYHVSKQLAHSFQLTRPIQIATQWWSDVGPIFMIHWPCIGLQY